jgi:NADPH:quinone reductase-like Zn-dependent oxidoreductase
VRAVRIHDDGGPEVLSLDDVPVPEPGPGTALVRVRSASLNHLDMWVRQGLPSVPKPRILGADASGIVEAVGPGVEGLDVGAAVTVNPGLYCGTCAACLAGDQTLCPRFQVVGEHTDGTHAEYVVLPARNLFPIPAGLSFDEAAAFPLVFVTAHRMLFHRARVQAGEWVLAWGVGGGVASAALVLATAAGARVIATSSSDEKLERARQLGAVATINHATGDVRAQVKEITGGAGVDLVVEHVGEATYETSLAVLAKGGRLVTCGATTGGGGKAGLHRIFWKQLTVLGSTMGSDSDFRALLRLIDASEVRPIVDRVFPLEEARQAHEHLEAGRQFGKVVLRVSE